MNQYFVRVELGGVGIEGYSQFHLAMRLKGFSRTVFTNGQLCWLPRGTYSIRTPLSRDWVNGEVVSIASVFDEFPEVITLDGNYFSSSGLTPVSCFTPSKPGMFARSLAASRNSNDSPPVPHANFSAAALALLGLNR